MIRRGISSTALILVATLVVVAMIEAAMFLVSFPNALQLSLISDVPLAVIVGGVAFLLRRRGNPRVVQAEVPQALALDKLRVRNGGRRAPVKSAESILDQDEEPEADVFAGTPDLEKRARDVDEILQRMKAREMYLGAEPDREVEPRAQPIIVEPEPGAERPTLERESKPKGKIRNYVLSPEKLKVPAFVCRCGHAHRFVCLTCGVTVEKAAKKSKTHWVEWVPEMGVLP